MQKQSEDPVCAGSLRSEPVLRPGRIVCRPLVVWRPLALSGLTQTPFADPVPSRALTAWCPSPAGTPWLQSISKFRQLIEFFYQTLRWTFRWVRLGHGLGSRTDARGPLPLPAARKRLGAMETGHVLRMMADDPAAIIDVPHYCSESGNELLEASDGADGQVYLIRRA